MQKFFTDLEDGNKSFWCPGCEVKHLIDPKIWKLSWDKELPTVTPSLIAEFYSWKYKKDMICHLYIKKGTIQYLGDCGHDLKNKTVNMEKVKK